MAGAETGHVLGDSHALDPPLEGHPLGRAPGQRNGAGVVLPGRGVAAGPPFQVSPGRPVEGIPGQLPLPGQGDQFAAPRADAVPFGPEPYWLGFSSRFPSCPPRVPESHRGDVVGPPR